MRTLTKFTVMLFVLGTSLTSCSKEELAENQIVMETAITEGDEEKKPDNKPRD